MRRIEIDWFTKVAVSVLQSHYSFPIAQKRRSATKTGMERFQSTMSEKKFLYPSELCVIVVEYA